MPRLSTFSFAENYLFNSPYAYCAADPINLIDPSGMAVVYNQYGRYLGETSEGFTGMVYIYSGDERNIKFGELNESQLLDKYGSKLKSLSKAFNDRDLDSNNLARIWTDIVKHFEGLNVFDEVFSMNSIKNHKIKYSDKVKDEQGDGDVVWGTKTEESPSSIYGTGKMPYESTVENIASAILIHEWYAHGMKKVADRYKSHRWAYKAVINDPVFWEKTTPEYKRCILINLRYYTIMETGAQDIEKQYRSLFNLYVLKKRK